MCEGLEPNYIYKKGVGWIVAPPHATLTRVINDYEVTLENRKPEPHERFYAEPTADLDRCMEAIANLHSSYLDKLGNPYSRIADFPSNHFDNLHWVTVSTRKL